VPELLAGTTTVVLAGRGALETLMQPASKDAVMNTLDTNLMTTSGLITTVHRISDRDAR
jgi:hypothetical protein